MRSTAEGGLCEHVCECMCVSMRAYIFRAVKGMRERRRVG